MLAERPGESQMQATTFSGQQVLVDRFSQQCMAKRIARRGGVVAE